MRQTRIELIDDIDGSPADETVTFGLDGTNYEIDLTDRNAAELRDLLAQYVGCGRKVGRGGSADLRVVRPSAARAVPDRARLAAIRSWAQDNGVDINPRGRIANSVVEAYETAQALPPAAVEAAPEPKKRARTRRPKA
jgi:hypothetical protein